MITPIQRIPRYQLLLKDLLKKTPEDHVDYEGLKTSLEKVTEINTVLNGWLTEYEMRQSVRKIGEEFNGNVSFIEPQRYFVKRGEAHKVGRKNDTKYTFFLFNDLLVYAKGSPGRYTL